VQQAQPAGDQQIEQNRVQQALRDEVGPRGPLGREHGQRARGGAVDLRVTPRAGVQRQPVAVAGVEHVAHEAIRRGWERGRGRLDDELHVERRLVDLRRAAARSRQVTAVITPGDQRSVNASSAHGKPHRTPSQRDQKSSIADA
jgi:hypothetical protein